MDEPFAALDEITRAGLNDDLLALAREDGITVIFVTHSVMESAYLSSRVLVMSPRPGRITADIALARPDSRDRLSPEFAAPGPRRRRPAGGGMKRAFPTFCFPLLLGVALLALWQWIVRRDEIPPYVLPAPLAIAQALIDNFASLMASLLATLRVTVEAFVAALIAGVAVAILFSQSRLAERALYPYAVILQVTPVVAIAPLILIWVGFDRINTALVLIAGSGGLLSHSLQHHAGPEIRRLQSHGIDAALWRLALANFVAAAIAHGPALSAGRLKIAGGLALIGAVVAEFVAGSGTATGLAWRIVEAGNRLEIATMFAALGLLASLGVAIFAALSGLEYLLLRRWHESALKRQS